MMIPIVILAIESDSDREYMTLLYQNHQALMLKTAWQYTKNKADVEDIVSDSCASLIEKIETIRDMEKNALRAYIVTTVRNKAIDFCRKQQRRNAKLQEFDEEEVEAIADHESVERKILLREELKQVLEALHHLPEHERDILRLKYQKGMSDREIADITGLAESSIRKYIARSRKYLKAVLYEGEAQ